MLPSHSDDTVRGNRKKATRPMHTAVSSTVTVTIVLLLSAVLSPSSSSSASIRSELNKIRVDQRIPRLQALVLDRHEGHELVSLASVAADLASPLARRAYHVDLCGPPVPVSASARRPHAHASHSRRAVDASASALIDIAGRSATTVENWG